MEFDPLLWYNTSEHPQGQQRGTVFISLALGSDSNCASTEVLADIS